MHITVHTIPCADDILESFLSEYRHKRHSHHGHPFTTAATAASTTPPLPAHTADALSHDPQLEGEPLTSPLPLPDEEEEGEGEGEGDREGEGGEEVFATPELPIGRELVINILSTWGDRFYVGLTGIEVYTASGQPANIKKVFILWCFYLET